MKREIRAGNVNVSYYKTVQEILDVMDRIENDSVNYDGNWMRGGPDIQLKEVAKKKLALLEKKLYSLDEWRSLGNEDDEE